MHGKCINRGAAGIVVTGGIAMDGNKDVSVGRAGAVNALAQRKVIIAVAGQERLETRLVRHLHRKPAGDLQGNGLFHEAAGAAGARINTTVARIDGYDDLTAGPGRGSRRDHYRLAILLLAIDIKIHHQLGASDVLFQLTPGCDTRLQIQHHAQIGPVSHGAAQSLHYFLTNRHSGHKACVIHINDNAVRIT